MKFLLGTLIIDFIIPYDTRIKVKEMLEFAS